MTGIRSDPSAMSRREAEVACLVSDGLTNKEIARRLGLTVSTVKTHVEHCLHKTATVSRTTLALKVHEKGHGSRVGDELSYAQSCIEELQEVGAMGDMRRNGTLAQALAHIRQARLLLTEHSP